jgi:hypothetical protein
MLILKIKTNNDHREQDLKIELQGMWNVKATVVATNWFVKRCYTYLMSRIFINYFIIT